MEEEIWATGECTAMVSQINGSVYIILPRAIPKFLGGIENREILKLRVIKTGRKKEKRFDGAGTKNLIHVGVRKIFPNQNPPTEEEREFIAKRIISQNPAELAKAKGKFGKERIEFLIRDYVEPAIKSKEVAETSANDKK